MRNKLSTVSENILLSTIAPLNADIFSDTIRVTMITKTVTMSEQIRDGLAAEITNYQTKFYSQLGICLINRRDLLMTLLYIDMYK